MVGCFSVLQHRPSSVILAVPVEVTCPPAVALVAVISVAA